MGLDLKVRCWRPRCKNHTRNFMFSFKKLKKVKESNEHYDYRCPLCKSVILCSNKKL